MTDKGEYKFHPLKGIWQHPPSTIPAEHYIPPPFQAARLADTTTSTNRVQR